MPYCIPCMSTFNADIFPHCPNCRGRKMRDKRADTAAHVLKRRAEIAEENRLAAQHDTQRKREWRQANPDKVARANVARKRSVAQACPDWLGEEDHMEIAAQYHTASYVTEFTGIPHHVDHIIPLRGSNVCGLHVPWNLQVIPAKANLSKSNKH